MGSSGKIEIGIGRTLDLPFAEALTRTESALQKEGFGIITRVDVQATMREKLGIEGRPFVILGACNPHMAHRALTLEPSVALLLPCNVVVRALEDGTTRLEAVNAASMAMLFPEADLSPVTREIGDRLARVLAAV
jgi:uncharacterized protein (DUF302 family)